MAKMAAKEAPGRTKEGAALDLVEAEAEEEPLAEGEPVAEAPEEPAAVVVPDPEAALVSLADVEDSEELTADRTCTLPELVAEDAGTSSDNWSRPAVLI
jgi:hypothetical protein